MVTRVLVMAGGTGGHVFPALAVAHELRGGGAEVTWLGTRRGLEATLVPPAGFAIDWIAIGGLRGKGAIGWLTAPFRVLFAVAQSVAVLFRRRPTVVLGMGGFASGPGGLAAALLRIPLVVHEQNAVPGFTNQWLARLASAVLEAFPGAFPARRHARHTGNPVRREIAEVGAAAVTRAEAGRPLRLLVLGGSQGARALNRLLPEALALPEAGAWEVRHQAGRAEAEACAADYHARGVAAQVMPFIDDMAEAYRWADLVVCRAGAMTVAELGAAGLGALFVPFPQAVDDHQTANARHLEAAGAALIEPQATLTAARLAARLGELRADRGRIAEMGRRARAHAQPGATAAIAETCLALARRHAGATNGEGRP